MTDIPATQPTNGTGKKQHSDSKTGAPRGNSNRTTHGLHGGKLPAGCRYIENNRNALRRQVESEIMDARGRITVVEAALTQSLCRHETRAQLIYRWLREADGSNAGLSILDRVQLLREISAATDRQNIRVTDSKQNWLIF